MAVKVRVALEGDSGVGGETLWALPTDKPDEFEINNVPFFAPDLHLGDIVRVEIVEEVIEGLGYEMREVREVVRRSGNETLSLILDEGLGEEDIRGYIGELTGTGCAVERAIGSVVSVSVPPRLLEEGVDGPALKEPLVGILERWQKEGIWEA